MSAKDFFHDHVRDALEADGWTITSDPFFVRVGKKNLPIDLAAERLIAAERDAEKIAVEIKRFRINRCVPHALRGTASVYWGSRGGCGE